MGFIIRTSLIGPIPNDWQWRISVVRPADEANNVLVINAPVWSVDDRERRIWVEGDPDGGQTTSYGRYVSVNTNDTVNMNMELVGADGTTVHDSGTVAGLRWDSSTSSSRLLASASGGLTAEEHQQLADTERRTRTIGEPTDLTVNTPSGLLQITLGQLLSRSFLNNLVLEEVTAGETCAPVRFTYNEWYAGIAIDVTTIDPALSPKTPDQDWYFPDLAVLRLFRGSHLRWRRGIHTPTFITNEPYEWGWNIRNVLEVLGGPPATTVAVDWRPGCCGRVYLVRIP